MKPVFLSLLLLCAIALPASAHIGTQNVFYEGAAGPYQLRVSIQPPPVVPGRAQIHVRVHNGPVESIGVLPVRWDAGRKGAPPPDPALAVTGEPGLYTAELWIMDFGAYSVFVDVDGPLGKGTTIVPFNSISSQRLGMPRWMGAAFLVTGFGLILFLIGIVGAAVRESVLPPANEPGKPNLRRSRFGMLIATVLLSALLWKGNAWWTSVDEHFKNARLYKTIEVPSRVEQRDTNLFLVLTIQPGEENWRDRTPLVADHGKLMHLFLVSDTGMNAFAHLHPTKTGDDVFEVKLPQLGEGSYTVYADINHESGLTETLLSKVKLPPSTAVLRPPDEDESVWSISNNLTIGSDTRRGVLLPNGGTLQAVSPLTTTARKETILRFEPQAPDGKPLPLEPYLGMWSHAVIRAHDGSVFTHLHPSGTISMASQELFARRERGEDLRKPIDVVCGRPERELSFPFSFPSPGKYRIWVQIKSAGEVQTGAYDIDVVPDAG